MFSFYSLVNFFNVVKFKERNLRNAVMYLNSRYLFLNADPDVFSSVSNYHFGVRSTMEF